MEKTKKLKERIRSLISKSDASSLSLRLRFDLAKSIAELKGRQEMAREIVDYLWKKGDSDMNGSYMDASDRIKKKFLGEE
jgi:hypothetical protein